MLVVDASCLYAVVADTVAADELRELLAGDTDQIAPHVIDVEVLGVISRDRLRGELDETAASLAVEDLRAWPGERYSHRSLLPRAWELRGSVRVWDAMYVALAEAMDATLLTLDRRLAGATGLRCPVVVPSTPA